MKGAERDAWTQLITKQEMAKSIARTAKRSKHGAIVTVAGGRKFQSAKEAARYMDLAMLQAAKKITALELQPEFPILIAPLAGGPLVRVARYHADFAYLENGVRIVEDVKGESTKRGEAYRLRKAIVEALYGITIRET